MSKGHVIAYVLDLANPVRIFFRNFELIQFVQRMSYHSGIKGKRPVCESIQ
jgi:hypothetical protein